MTILVWLLGVWIGVSLVVGGSWMLLVEYWRRKASQGGAAAGFLSGFPVAAPGRLPGSAHPPGSVKAREEPGSTNLGGVGHTDLSAYHPDNCKPRRGPRGAETGPPLKLVP